MGSVPWQRELCEESRERQQTESDPVQMFPGASLGAQMVKQLPAMQETQVQSLGREDLLEKEMATHSSTLALKNPMEGGACQATVPGAAKSHRTEQLHSL